jgi:hypothetical protein
MLQKNMDSSLERIISSPQTIYVQPVEDADEVMQLNSSESEKFIHQTYKS